MRPLREFGTAQRSHSVKKDAGFVAVTDMNRVERWAYEIRTSFQIFTTRCATVVIPAFKE